MPPRGHELPSEYVTRDLRERIKRGEWASGEAIPPVKQLQEHYACSAATIHKAVRQLVEEGLLRTRPRWATTVV
jgi:GntR family transcriptional regulator